MTDILHEDNTVDSVVLPDGRVIRNLSADEYAATYATGTAHDALEPDAGEAGVAE